MLRPAATPEGARGGAVAGGRPQAPRTARRRGRQLRARDRLRRRRHRRVRPRRRRALLPRAERAHPGRAPGHRGGHRDRPRRAAAPDRGGRAPARSRGARTTGRPRRRGASVRGGPAHVPAASGANRAAAAAERRARGCRRRGGRRDRNRLRRDDREADRPRRHARRGARPARCCACRDRRRGRDDEPAAPALARRAPRAPRRRDDDRVPCRLPPTLAAGATPGAAVAGTVPPQPAGSAARPAARRRRPRGPADRRRRRRPLDGHGADAGDCIARARRARRPRDGAAAAGRPRGDEDGDAARRALRGGRAHGPRARRRPCRRRRSARRARRRRLGEELLQLQRRAGVAGDLELAGHVGGDGVLLAGGDAAERLPAHRDRDVRLRTAFAHMNGAVANLDEPLALAVDVEKIRVVDAVDPRRIGARLERLEELARVRHDSLTGRRRTSPTRRTDGSLDPTTIASTGTSAVAQRAARRSTESASAPSATAPIPPSPIENPVERPDAVPIRLGRYSWLSTIVTPNVPTTITPASARQTAPGTPPRRMKPAIRGGVAIMLAISTSRRPKRSAVGPATTVPIAPARSISESRWLP